MAEKNLLVLEKKGSFWDSFLQEFFEDTRATLHWFEDSLKAGSLFNRLTPDIVFSNPKLLSLPFAQKMNVLRHSRPDFRVFRLGTEETAAPSFVFDDQFEPVSSFEHFQRKLLEHLPLPEKIRVLVVDNEVEIGTMVRDFLERRVNPSFEVDYAPNGEEGIRAIENKKPDVLVLDIKMPIKDGREVYREITSKGLKIPTIIFFDAISGDEMVEIHKVGKPAVIEKGSRQSAMPELMALIKKMAYFG